MPCYAIFYIKQFQGSPAIWVETFGAKGFLIDWFKLYQSDPPHPDLPTLERFLQTAEVGMWTNLEHSGAIVLVMRPQIA